LTDASADLTMLPMYHIRKILPIYIGNICSLKQLYYCPAGVFGNISCYFVSDWLIALCFAHPSESPTTVDQVLRYCVICELHTAAQSC